MDDRELLEKAARAVGCEYSYGNCADGSMTGYLEMGCEITYWNPIQDNGDAFWLLFEIKADVYHGENEFGEPIVTIQPPYLSLSESPNALVDSEAEIRRAITRAAAALADEDK